MPTHTTGVLGAGVMGAGIAQVLAAAGHDVRCHDLSAEALEKARDLVDTGRFGLRSAVERGKLSVGEAEAALSGSRSPIAPRTCTMPTS